MGQTMELRLRQHLTLTPQLQQALRLLQLSSLEFEQEMREALDTNPFLEEEEDAARAEGGTTTADAPTTEAPAPEPEVSPAPDSQEAARRAQRHGRDAAQLRQATITTTPTGPNGRRRSSPSATTCAASSCCRRWESATARSRTW